MFVRANFVVLKFSMICLGNVYEIQEACADVMNQIDADGDGEVRIILNINSHSKYMRLVLILCLEAFDNFTQR